LRSLTAFSEILLLRRRPCSIGRRWFYFAEARQSGTKTFNHEGYEEREDTEKLELFFYFVHFVFFVVNIHARLSRI